MSTPDKKRPALAVGDRVRVRCLVPASLYPQSGTGTVRSIDGDGERVWVDPDEGWVPSAEAFHVAQVRRLKPRAKPREWFLGLYEDGTVFGASTTPPPAIPHKGSCVRVREVTCPPGGPKR